MMLCSFAVLAAHAGDRIVLYDPCQSLVRLVWKRAVLHVTVDEFHDLLIAFEQSLNNGRESTCGLVRLTRHEDGFYDLHVDEVAIRLTSVDYWLFGRLIETAWYRLEHDAYDAQTRVPSDGGLHLN